MLSCFVTTIDSSPTKQSCRGWYSMIHCIVRRSCDLCTANESTALEVIAKTKVLALQASLCYHWKLPLNVTKSWCNFSENVFGLIIVIGSLLTLSLLTLGYLVYKWKLKEHNAKRRIRKVTIKRVKSSPSAKEEGKVNTAAKSQKTAVPLNKSTSSKTKKASKSTRSKATSKCSADGRSNRSNKTTKKSTISAAKSVAAGGGGGKSTVSADVKSTASSKSRAKGGSSIGAK